MNTFKSHLGSSYSIWSAMTVQIISAEAGLKFLIVLWELFVNSLKICLQNTTTSINPVNKVDLLDRPVKYNHHHIVIIITEKTRSFQVEQRKVSCCQQSIKEGP